MSKAAEAENPGIVLEVVVFICGAVVMAYEIVGARIVSPYIGTSTYIWTSLIGVILAALSIGYWIGGRLADRKPLVSILAFAIFISGGLISMTILINEAVLSLIATARIGLELKAVLAAIFLFAPASVSLGFVIPYATKLRISSLDDTGKTVGRLNALSTVGSIFGTFLAGFVLIPFVGSNRSLYLIAASLFLLSVILTPLVISRISIASLLLFVSGVAATEFSAYSAKHTLGITNIDTLYSRIRIFDTVERKTGRKITALTTDPYSVQSAIFHDSDDLALEYTKFYHLVGHYRPDHRRTLMIGGAGYSFPREYLRKYNESRIDVVEIDAGVTQAARDHFRLVDDDRLSIFHEDGRIFLNDADTAKYDAVMMDAFGSLFSIPFHLTTVEAVKQIHRVLDDDGVVILNLGSAVSGDAAGFFNAAFATYRAVFEFVDVYKVDPMRPDTDLQNIILVASKKKIASPAGLDDTHYAHLLGNKVSVAPEDDRILTDDLAPVEYFSSVAHSAGR